jgi:YVTN family beta-propeller protein
VLKRLFADYYVEEPLRFIPIKKRGEVKFRLKIWLREVSLLTVFILLTLTLTINRAYAAPMTITVGSGPEDIAFDSNLNELFVTNNGANTVSVISDATDKVVATITVGTAPFGIAFDPNNNEVYVANFGPGVPIGTGTTVSVISDATNKVIKTITVGVSPAGVAFDPNLKEIFVANGGSNTVSVISDATNTVVKTITIPRESYGIPSPTGIVFDPHNNEL